jgi:hypothetical protein
MYTWLNLEKQSITNTSDLNQDKNSSPKYACMCWRRVISIEAKAPIQMHAPYWSLRIEPFTTYGIPVTGIGGQ